MASSTAALPDNLQISWFMWMSLSWSTLPVRLPRPRDAFYSLEACTALELVVDRAEVFAAKTGPQRLTDQHPLVTRNCMRDPEATLEYAKAMSFAYMPVARLDRVYIQALVERKPSTGKVAGCA